tara:strand:- start:278 stop:997 length:720 start_codon:yes stop_codon:yes gene_type:complete
MIINRNWLFNVFRSPDAGEDAGGASTTGVQTDNVDTSTVLTATDNTDTSTVLTATDSDAAPAADDNASGEAATGEEADLSSQTVPDTYADFVMPEGVELDSTLLTEAAPLFKELGLNQDQAQKLVDFQAKQAKASSENSVNAFNQLMNDWQEQSKNDKEFGGDKFQENVGVARSAIDKFGTPELKQLLEEHGVGNHPEVIRFMVKVGKLTAEDVPGGTIAAPSTAQDRVSLLYPNDKTA